MTVFSRVVMQRGRLRAVFLFGPLLFGQSQAPRLTRPSSLIASMRLTLGDDTLKDTKLYRTMPLEDLWKLHEEVISALASRVEAQKLELEKRLEQLGTRFGRLTNGSSPAETWSGRGKQPQWVLLLLAKGGSLEDCRIQ
jgi:DNA-binding protein H-NS